MNIRGRLQDGCGRLVLSTGLPLIAACACYMWWPDDTETREKWLSGFQKIAFVAAAFAVTAYNLRTRVVDFVLKVEGKPARIDEFGRIARSCGKRLTNLVILFMLTAVFLTSLTVFKPDTSLARLAIVIAMALFTASVVSFFYILFSFERLERFALDEAETNARKKEAERLFGDDKKI